MEPNASRATWRTSTSAIVDQDSKENIANKVDGIQNILKEFSIFF